MYSFHKLCLPLHHGNCRTIKAPSLSSLYCSALNYIGYINMTVLIALYYQHHLRAHGNSILPGWCHAEIGISTTLVIKNLSFMVSLFNSQYNGLVLLPLLGCKLAFSKTQ